MSETTQEARATYVAIDQSRLFLMSCVALVVTAMTFAIRAGILGDLGSGFSLNNTELGWVNAMAFLGFPVAMLIGGMAYNQVGARNLMVIAFVGHVAGLLLTIFANGFWLLIISTFCIGFANGAVEAACNPLIADMYSKNKTTMLNRFHVWFPGGIVIGSLVAQFLGGIGWQGLLAVMLLPTAFYGYLLFTTAFPETRSGWSSTTDNLKALASPLFLYMLVLMTMTATTELGTGQWINQILAGTGASPMLILALVTGVMAVGRYFAGPVVHRLNPLGVLLASAIVSTIGLWFLSRADGPSAYAAAVVFAMGVTYFWPTMIGVVSEYQPRTGALGLSLIGGAGMFGVSIWMPIIGGWLDSAKEQAMSSGVTGAAADLAAGQAVLDRIMVFPIILVFAFALLVFLRPRRAASHASAVEASI